MASELLYDSTKIRKSKEFHQQKQRKQIDKKQTTASKFFLSKEDITSDNISHSLSSSSSSKTLPQTGKSKEYSDDSCTRFCKNFFRDNGNNFTKWRTIFSKRINTEGDDAISNKKQNDEDNDTNRTSDATRCQKGEFGGKFTGTTIYPPDDFNHFSKNLENFSDEYNDFSDDHQIKVCNTGSFKQCIQKLSTVTFGLDPVDKCPDEWRKPSYRKIDISHETKTTDTKICCQANFLDSTDVNIHANDPRSFLCSTHKCYFRICYESFKPITCQSKKRSVTANWPMSSSPELLLPSVSESPETEILLCCYCHNIICYCSCSTANCIGKHNCEPLQHNGIKQPIRQYFDIQKRFTSKFHEWKSSVKTNALYAVNDLHKFLRAILPILILFNMLPLLYAGEPQALVFPFECDQTFVSRVGGPQNGTFSAPVLQNPTNHSRQCLYIFLAGPGQRVEVVFTKFNLRGNPPDGSAVGELPSCVHEYMDIYAEVQSSDPADLINSPFGGRYCGPIPPRRRISMYRAIAMSFFTNKNATTFDVFEGRYTFINASEYEIGIPIAGHQCSYTVTPSMSINKTGALISPTYPGAYPKDMSCTYQFLGETNQRVRLEFRDFDLFFGGPHCPFDYVKVYDGPDNSSALIGTYCGQQRNLVIYSSESSLFVHFFTLPRTANTQNRGFKGIYEFSESFVKLEFIRQNDGIHIRGSECDQKILSKKESTGHVYSPNYPFPYIPKTVCRYFIYGMQDAQHLERVRLEFFIFEIPKVEHKDKSESNCTDGYLKIYLKGQETADAYDKFDYELCGTETQSVVSDGPRLAMVFSSGELQGRGFKAKYTFETEYKIPGTAAPDGSCSFTYRSTSKKKGDLNSPRYPSNYPSDTNCSYLFLALPNEQVTIVFDHFKVKADNVNATGGAYGTSVCFEDWLEMYVIYRDGPDRFLGRYCGLTAPGPVESPKGAVGIRIFLHTDQENVASGFKARYVFEAAKSEFGDCGGNYSGQDSGTITSPNYPANYKGPPKGLASNACNWYITARMGYKISINFEFFSVEGDPAGRGCPAAVLRLWTNLESEAPPIELCGEKVPTEHWHYISQGQSARISFTTTDKTIGAQGFRIVWTEIQDSGPGPPSSITLLCESTYHFQCNSGYCIADKLRCDGIKNCGPGDDSDEMHCESYHGSSQRGSRRSNNLQHSRRLVPNLSPMHTLSSQKKTQASPATGVTS